MNNNALVIVGTPEDNLTEILAFIDAQTKGRGGEDYEILDTFPILYACTDKKESAHNDLKPYISEELTFVNGRNDADQTLVEILELLDTTDVYIGGDKGCAEVSEISSVLSDSGFKVHML